MRILTAFIAFASIATAQDSKPMFDGKTLEGWKPAKAVNAKYWSVIDGVITASSGGKKMPVNTYLASTKSYQNFDFTCKFRLSGDPKTGLINSGIQYRTLMQRTPNKPNDFKVVGYQADIGKGYWGDIYDEHRRGKLVKGNTKELYKNFKDDDWHSYRILCEGNRHRLYINGHLTADYLESDSSIHDFGVIALQLHSGGICKMEYKDIMIKELPHSPLQLPLEIAGISAKIHGRTLTRRNGMIVSWNNTKEFLEWQIPEHIRPGKYEIILNYSCDKRRQGSDMILSSKLSNYTFKTKGVKKKWSPGNHSIGVFDIQANDKLTLKCSKLAEEWVLDFHRITFEPQVK